MWGWIVALLCVCVVIGTMWKFGKVENNKEFVDTLQRVLGIDIRSAVLMVKELARKGFHLLGLVFPLCYYIGISQPLWPFSGPDAMTTPILTAKSSSVILITMSTLYLLSEWLRLSFPVLHDIHWQRFSWLMRRRERGELMGMFWYFLGVTVTISAFSPIVAVISQSFLILGDFCAALAGRAFGKHKMFKFLGMTTADNLIVSCIGAFAATVAELLSNQPTNLMMPVIGGLFMHLVAFIMRIPIPSPIAIL